MDQEMSAKLRAPFPEETIGKLPKVWCKRCSSRDTKCEEHKVKLCKTCRARITEAHIDISYVGHAHVRERLIEVDPAWEWVPMAFTAQGLPALDDNGGLWINLTVGGKTLPGYGDAPGKRGGDAIKECIGDALRNAGQSFGIALDLWKKEAPAPVPAAADRPAEQKQATQSPEQRAAELRGQIVVIARNKSKGNATRETVAADFSEWSRGTDILQASVALLVEYKDHLQNGGQA